MSEDSDKKNEINNNENKLDPNKNEIKRIVLKISLQDSSEPLHVKVKKSTKWSKIFTAFSNHARRDIKALRFMYDGNRINPDQTQTVGEVYIGIYYIIRLCGHYIILTLYYV